MTVLASVFFCPRNWLFTQSNLTHLHRNVVIFSIKNAGALEIRGKKSANTRKSTCKPQTNLRAKYGFRVKHEVTRKNRSIKLL